MIYLCTNHDHKWEDDVEYIKNSHGLLKICNVCRLKATCVRSGINTLNYYISDKTDKNSNCNEIIMKNILK